MNSYTCAVMELLSAAATMASLEEPAYEKKLHSLNMDKNEHTNREICKTGGLCLCQHPGVRSMETGYRAIQVTFSIISCT